MSEYLPLGISCIRCGAPLSARTNYNGVTISIKGILPLEYIHTKSGEAQCWVKSKATPFDDWTASSAYERAAANLHAE